MIKNTGRNGAGGEGAKILKEGRNEGRERWRERGREGKGASKNLKGIMRKRTSKKPFNFVFCGPSPAGNGACH